MNKIELAKRRNDIARLFQHSSTIKRNCIRINTGSTYDHELEKFKICWELQKEGMHFLTEAVFERTGDRADIVCLDEGICYEIVKSESNESIKAKHAKYPLPVRVRRLKP